MGCNVSANAILTVEELREPDGTAPTSARVSQRHASPAHTSETSANGRGRQGSKSSLPPSEPGSARGDFGVRVEKRPGDVLGAGLGNTDKGAVIFNIQDKGLLSAWNKANPSQALYSGLIITEVNGVRGYWSILEELRKPGVLAMTVTSTPPKNAGSNWFQEIAEMGRNLEAQGGKSSFMLRLQPQDPNSKNSTFSSLPNVKAGEVGVEQCAICIEDVGEDETMVQLPCKHAFHALCAARWLTQAGKHSQGKRQCCPLCCRKVVSTADGGISTVEEAQNKGGDHAMPRDGA